MKNIAKEDTGIKYQMKVYAQECYAKKLPLSVLSNLIIQIYFSFVVFCFNILNISIIIFYL